MVFRGSFLSALGRNWHPEHFNCAGCRKSLQNKGFVEESDHLYCENCYDMKFAPHCDVCNEAIVGVSFHDGVKGEACLLLRGNTVIYIVISRCVVGYCILERETHPISAKAYRFYIYKNAIRKIPAQKLREISPLHLPSSSIYVFNKQPSSTRYLTMR